MQRQNMTPEEYTALEEKNLAEIREEVRKNTKAAFSFWQERVKQNTTHRTQRRISKPEADQGTVLTKPSSNELQPLEAQVDQFAVNDIAVALLDAVLEADYNRASEFARTSPAAMFQEVTITTPAGDTITTSPLKRAFYNLDYYMWNMFEEIAKENNMLYHFEAQLQEQNKHINLNELTDKYSEYRLNKEMPSSELQKAQYAFLVDKHTGATHVLREFARRDLKTTFDYYQHQDKPNKNQKIANIGSWAGEGKMVGELRESSIRHSHGIQLERDGLLLVRNIDRKSLHYDEFTLKGIFNLRSSQLANRRMLLKNTPVQLTKMDEDLLHAVIPRFI